MSDKPEEELPLLIPIQGTDEDGLYELNGAFVGKVKALQEKDKPIALTLDKFNPPDELTGLARLLWILKRECAHNPLTVFEVYHCLASAVQGAFFLMPFEPFSGQKALWEPFRRIFGCLPGMAWYDTGAELVAGTILFVLPLIHLIGICHGRRGDKTRRITFTCLIVMRFALFLMFVYVDNTVQNYANTLLACVFLIVAFREFFRKSYTR